MKKSTFGKFVLKDGQYCLENTVRIDGKEQEEKEYVALEELGFMKEFKGFWIEEREAVDSYTLLRLKGYFKHYFILKLRKRKTLKHTYLKKEGSRLIVRDFSTEGYGIGRGNVTHVVGLTEMQTNDDMFSFQPIGKPKRISQTTLEALKKDEGFVGIFNQRKWQEA